MGKNILVLTLFIIQINFAQNITQLANGNVGIGITTPNARLDLGSGYGSSGAKFLLYNDNPTSELAGTKCGFYMDNFGSNNLNLVFPEAVGHPGLFTISAKNTASTSLSPYFSIAGLTGNVGIGTTNPKSKFDVTDWTTALTIGSRKNTEAMVDSEVISAINFYKHYNIGYAGAIKLLQAGDGNQYSPAHLAFYTTSGGNVYTTAPEERMRITSLGNIGIGTSTPDSKLAVNGTIHSKEVKVDMNGWSDFVFKKDYDLPTLEEVEKHINDKGHLENIPSEEEVLKNGINLGEINSKLLQKIEELTLYIIQQKKKNTVQTLEIENFKNEIKNSKNEIETLKKENESFKNILERLSIIEEKLK